MHNASMSDTTNSFRAWPSVISAQRVASAATRYSSVQLDGDDLYWLEGRPQEQGRSVVVRRRADEVEDVLPAPWNVRSRVHEYGGGALVVYQGQFWFVNDADQQIYSCIDGEVKQITHAPDCRFADLLYCAAHDCLYAVMENHGEARSKGKAAVPEPVNTLVQVNLSTAVVTEIAAGDDFYAAPAISPDGRHLAWLGWRHPDMPWDSTTLWLADLDDSGLAGNTRSIIEEKNQAVFQPMWSPDGRLYFINDPQGWWQLYRLNDLTDANGVEQVCDFEAEMGLPLWQFGMQTYGFRNANQIIAMLCEQGLWRLVRICTSSGEVEPIATPYNTFDALSVSEHRIALLASGAATSDSVALLENDSITICNQAAAEALDTAWLSEAQPIRFPTTGNMQAHGFYYAPKNPDIEATNELPPLLVMSHGGPTGATSAGLNLKIQYWTSRGFAVLDVNYRGSTGFGRAYREALKGRWGIVDVDDVVAGAEYLVQQGLADPARLAIRGSSAGGYTTLAALTFRDTFTVGASYYGIGELESLARDTHKFEARYLDSLVGRYPQERALYRERSPLRHAERLSCPVIFMQGEEDKVVPPAQAEMMAEAMRKQGIACELLLFAGEQHGFRQAQTIVDTLQAELNFYERIFNQLQST